MKSSLTDLKALYNKETGERGITDGQVDEEKWNALVTESSKDIDEKKGLIQNQRLFLTYAIKLPKDKYIEWLKEKASSYPKMWVRIAHETYKKGENKGEYHSHVAIDFGKRFQTRRMNYFDYNDGQKSHHPNIKKVLNLTHWINVRKYLAKEDKSNKDLINVHSTNASKVWACSSAAEAAAITGVNPIHVNVLWELRSKEKTPVLKKTDNKGNKMIRATKINIHEKPWYRPLVDIAANAAYRKVVWVYSEAGGVGKSTWYRWLRQVGYGDDIAMISNISNRDNFMHTILNLKGGNGGDWSKQLLIVDFSRAAENVLSIYDCIEKVLDGYITSGKYNSTSVVWDFVPKIVVFSNWAPAIRSRNSGKRTLSIDRWLIYNLEEDKLTHVDARELENQQNDGPQGRGEC